MFKEENCKLKQTVADMSLDKVKLQDVLSKNRWKRVAVGSWSTTSVVDNELNIRRACRIALISRSLYAYRLKTDDQAELRRRICEIAAIRVRYDCQRIHVLLCREGLEINHSAHIASKSMRGCCPPTPQTYRERCALWKTECAARTDVVWSITWSGRHLQNNMLGI